MDISRQRVDKFISSGGSVDVTGRRNHTFSTEQYITQKQKVIFRVPAEEKASEWYHEDESGAVQPHPVSGSQDAHIAELKPVVDLAENANIDLSFATKEWALNETFDSLMFQGATVQNPQECRPRDQSKLLPYLCDYQAVSNLYGGSRTVSPALGHRQNEASVSATVATAISAGGTQPRAVAHRFGPVQALSASMCLQLSQSQLH